MRAALAALLLAGCACGAPRTAIPDYVAHRFGAPPTLDGDLSEWASVPRTEAFVSTMDGSAGDPEAYGRFAWDDAYLYVAFEISDPRVLAHGEGVDAHLWEEDCGELMFDPDGDGQSYVELQASPTNVVFDTLYDSRRVPQPFGHVEYASHLEARARVRGTANDDAGDDGYDLEMRIPWSAFAAGAHPITAAPHAGDVWRAAMYAIDVRGDEAWRASGWSPPLVGDFHVPDRFGRLTFAE